MAIFEVTQATDDGTGLTDGTLSKAILDANETSGDDTIVLKTDVTVSGVMKRLINSNITITGDDPETTGVVETASISGGDQFRPLFVLSGTVNIENLTLTNGRAEGGIGHEGGGGAGMGGALFIYDGTVTVENVDFTNNAAVGGDSIGSQLMSTRFGGGGMYGAGIYSGGGLFGSADSTEGGYGGYGGYGNYGGDVLPSGDGGFGRGGSGFNGDGGFGGGGAFHGDGGFGGGGGLERGNGGYGGGGGAGFGNGGFGGATVGSGADSGGGGAGFGGAIFARSGSLTVSNSSFDSNSATGGISVLVLRAGEGLGLGGAIFAMKSTTNSNGNNQGMPDSLPTVMLDNVTLSNNSAADDANTPNPTPDSFASGIDFNNDDLFGTTISGNTEDLPTLSIDDVTVSEGNNAIFTVSLSATSIQTITVDYATADNTATAGSDYLATSDSLTFDPGQTSQTITVEVLDDSEVEGEEGFFVDLFNPTNANIADSQGIGAIASSPFLELNSLDGTNGFIVNGINANEQSGRSVSNAGDVNGDGIDDLIRAC